MFLEISQNSQENTCARVSLRQSLQYLKKALAQVFSYEFCEISKEYLFLKNTPVATSVFPKLLENWFILSSNRFFKPPLLIVDHLIKGVGDEFSEFGAPAIHILNSNK